jgi:hypothetical protein
MAGFLAKDVYLFGSIVNPDGAFAPSLVTEQEHGENDSPGQPGIDDDEAERKETAYVRKSRKLLAVTDTTQLLTARIEGI